MAPRIDIARIWWRNVQPGEFYNIERYPSIEGSGGSRGGGSLYIEVPNSMVADTLRFLDEPGLDVESLPVITINAHVVGEPDVQGAIEFQRKTGRRMRIARQNRQQPGCQRHPAWTAERGFPRAPDTVRKREDALPYFPDGGLRIYIAKTFDGDYYAGFTEGPRPQGMSPNDPMAVVYPDSSSRPGGVWHA